MFERVCLIHYAEIGLKGRNRAHFERRLRDNLEAALVGLPVAASRRSCRASPSACASRERVYEVAERIAAIPGVAFVSPAFRTVATSRRDRSRRRCSRSARSARSRRSPSTLIAPTPTTRFRAWRPTGSIGAFLVAQTGAKVNLSKPDVKVRIDVVQGDVYVSTRRVPGVGGLPVGMSGRVVSLALGRHRLAGGDVAHDSPRCRRGGRALLGPAADQRPLRASRARDRRPSSSPPAAWDASTSCPSATCRRRSRSSCPPDLRVLLYRRLMIRVAERIARSERAQGARHR